MNASNSVDSVRTYDLHSRLAFERRRSSNHTDDVFSPGGSATASNSVTDQFSVHTRDEAVSQALAFAKV